jgi:hypothetical protein
MADLVITNGDSAAERFREAGITAPLLAWRDVLHDGPVPDTSSLEALSELRARYVAENLTTLPFDRVRAMFRERDALLREHRRFPRIDLWFEHDLYDQLQLWQVLSLLHAFGRHEGVRLVQADDYLGRQPPDTLVRFEANARDVTPALTALGAKLWDAVTAPTPAPMAALLEEDTSDLPFAHAATGRFLEELPGSDGLSRSERQILRAVADGAGPLHAVYKASLAMEEAEFVADLGFLRCTLGLAFGPRPLLRGLIDPHLPGDDAAYRAAFAAAPQLTPAGQAVLAGKADHIQLNGIDRWLGGTHLRTEQVWRWAGERLLSPV